jgi:LacI family transcriptional regulator
MITIKKVAELAKVSPSTVSNVLQGRVHKMRGDTLERVRKVLQENNYVSNMIGRTLGRYGSRIIAVVIDYEYRDKRNLMQQPFFSEIIVALEHEIRTSGYFMMLYISANVEESLRMAASWNAEGLIATGCSTENCRKLIQGAGRIGIPIVFIDTYYNGKASFYNIGLHDRQGGFLMTEYLISMGHKKIAFLADAATMAVGIDYERLEGCKAALKKQGMFFAPEDYVYISHCPGERQKNTETIYQRTAAYLFGVVFHL